MALPSPGMGLPLYERFMENYSLFLGRLLAGMKGKGCTAQLQLLDLRQARANWRRYHIRSHGEYNATPLPTPICNRGGIDPGSVGRRLAAGGVKGLTDSRGSDLSGLTLMLPAAIGLWHPGK